VPIDLQRDYRRPGTRITRPYETIRGRNRRVRLYDRGTTRLTGLGREAIPRRIPFEEVRRNTAQLSDLQ
jgi:hypothetical protein